jgi:hypothetical protein
LEIIRRISREHLRNLPQTFPIGATQTPEILMNTFSTKLTAFAAALLMNGLVMGALGYLFALQAQPHLSAIAFAHTVVAHHWA